jgi:serine protease inhibitor
LAHPGTASLVVIALRQFLDAIRDDQSGELLFIGSMLNPS